MLTSCEPSAGVFTFKFENKNNNAGDRMRIVVPLIPVADGRSDSDVLWS